MANPRCTVCGIELTPAQTSYREVTHCYVKTRAKGANAITLPIYSGRTYCEWCLLKAEKGTQLSLLDDDGG
jgi:hypothetical protein